MYRLEDCDMFAIGDKIVYPMHGVGIIEDIEQKEILGEVREYYVLHIPFGDMRVMVPVAASGEVGIRHIVDTETAMLAIQILSAPSTEMPPNWNKRYKENADKLKTGDIFEIAEVVRNLTRQDREKKLSTGEKKLLDSAKQVFVSAIMLVNSMTEEQVNQMIEETV